MLIVLSPRIVELYPKTTPVWKCLTPTRFSESCMSSADGFPRLLMAIVRSVGTDAYAGGHG